ncbi:unnamed protein product [Merluccius merluccius]
MTFGLHKAPAPFQHLMDRVLQGWEEGSCPRGESALLDFIYRSAKGASETGVPSTSGPSWGRGEVKPQSGQDLKKGFLVHVDQGDPGDQRSPGFESQAGDPILNH